jgi:hypothetical protein
MRYVSLMTAILSLCALGSAAAPLTFPGTPGRQYKSSDRTVGIYVFHWYTPTAGQTKSVWKPLEGRENWDGSVEFWKRQVKDIMDANIDIIHVHLIDGHEPQRVNLFKALSELRAEGYKTPNVVPFLDPAITFHGRGSHLPNVDVALPAGRDRFCGQYVRFYQQYFSVNTDEHAASYLGIMDGKPMLNVWSVSAPQMKNKDSLQREHVESYLKERLGDLFAKGIFMSSIIPDDTGLKWSDEWHRSFVGYCGDYLLKDGDVASLKPGHYDTLDRFLARNGGKGYSEAWDRILRARSIRRVLIESWNEYTEGTGLYEVANLEPDYGDPKYKPHDDRWGESSRTYIDITADKAARFNNVPELDARFLWHNLPKKMEALSTAKVTVILRNEGDRKWERAAGFHFRQLLSDDFRFLGGPVRWDDAASEIPKYGGIFRGRPVAFEFEITAPEKPGEVVTQWSMCSLGGRPFGERLQWHIQIVADR